MAEPHNKKSVSLNSRDEASDRSAAHVPVSLRYPILVCIVFSVLGLIYANTFFPELSTWRSIFAGFSFGLFCATCAATYSFLR